MSTFGASGSVSFAARAWILVNILHLAVGGLIFWGLLLPSAQVRPRLVTAVGWTIVFVFIGIGIAGILSGVAILRGNSRAQCLIASMSGVFAAFSVLVLMGCVSTWRDVPVSKSVAYLTRAFLPIAACVYFAAGMWWLTTFTREGVTNESEAKEKQSVCWVRSWKGQLPLAVLAEYFVINGMVALVTSAVTMSVPYMIFGFPLFGLAWKIFILVWGIFYLWVGATILLRKRWSLNVAIAASILFVLASLATLADSHSTNRMKDALTIMASHGSPQPKRDPTATLMYREELAVGVQLVTLAIILGSRRRYLDGFRVVISSLILAAISEEKLP